MAKKHLKGVVSLIALAIVGLSFTVAVHALPGTQIPRGITTSVLTQVSDNNADRLLEKGQLLYQESRFKEAVKIFQEAAEIYKSNNDSI
ncbi:MAG: hypothetical protein WBV73_07485 [Phormidium sp.]